VRCLAVLLLLVQLDLYKSVPSDVQQSPSQKLDNALATVAIGYQRHQPQLMQRAAALFQQLGEATFKVCCSVHCIIGTVLCDCEHKAADAAV
jgi:hypothetical protein